MARKARRAGPKCGFSAMRRHALGKSGDGGRTRKHDMPDGEQSDDRIDEEEACGREGSDRKFPRASPRSESSSSRTPGSRSVAASRDADPRRSGSRDPCRSSLSISAAILPRRNPSGTLLDRNAPSDQKRKRQRRERARHKRTRHESRPRSTHPSRRRSSDDGGIGTARDATRAEPGGTSTRNVHRGPSVAIAQYFRPFAASERSRGRREDAVGWRPPRGFQDHHQKRRRIRQLHRAESHRPAGSRAPRDPELDLVTRGESRLDEHRREDERRRRRAGSPRQLVELRRASLPPRRRHQREPHVATDAVDRRARRPPLSRTHNGWSHA